jgi:hypothetical protein
VVTEGLCFIILISREKELERENGEDDDEDYYYDCYQGIIASTTPILEYHDLITNAKNNQILNVRRSLKTVCYYLTN